LGDELAPRLQAGLLEAAAAGGLGKNGSNGSNGSGSNGSEMGGAGGGPAQLLQLMADPGQLQQRHDMRGLVESLETAARRLRNIAM